MLRLLIRNVNSKNSSIIDAISKDVIKTTVRYGGSRPGGRPTFNWKEKNQLKAIELKNNQNNASSPSSTVFNNSTTGDFDDIKHLFDPKNGDVVVDISDTDFDSEDFDKQYLSNVGKVINYDTSRKSVNISKLFGSHKRKGHALTTYEAMKKKSIGARIEAMRAAGIAK